MDHDATRGHTIENLFGSMVTDSGNLVSEVQGAAEARRMKELPVQGTAGSEDVWGRLGFELGPVSKDDDLFRPVLRHPVGWELKPDPKDPRHLKLFDNKGRVRALYFYKNASYDRYASISLMRRFSIGYYSMINRDFDDHRRMVHDKMRDVIGSGGHTSFCVLHVTEPDDSIEDKWKRADAQHDAAVAWLREHYPDSNDPAAYWDDDVPGEMIDVVPFEPPVATRPARRPIVKRTDAILLMYFGTSWPSHMACAACFRHVGEPHEPGCEAVR